MLKAGSPCTPPPPKNFFTPYLTGGSLLCTPETTVVENSTGVVNSTVVENSTKVVDSTMIENSTGVEKYDSCSKFYKCSKKS